MYPCQNIVVRTLRFSDVVMVLRWHEGECFAFRFLQSRLGLGLGLGLWLWVGLGWVLGHDGMDNIFLPLVIYNLGCGVVLVCPCIELLDLSVLQLALGHAIISDNMLDMQKDVLSGCCSCPLAQTFELS